MPTARRRARNRWTISKRSARSAPGQTAISLAVRMQPAQSRVVGSSLQIPTQGEGMSIKRDLFGRMQTA
jgi:hypothetical protein